MKWFKSNSWSLALLPAFLFTFCLVVYGLFMAAQESVTTLTGFSLDAYKNIFENEAFLDSLAYSLRIAFVSTALSLVLGLLLTKFLFETLKNHLARTIVWLPMLFPHFVWGYMMILLFSQTGWFSTMLHALFIIDSPDQFPVLTNDRYGIGIIITYTLKEIPFVACICTAQSGFAKCGEDAWRQQMACVQNSGVAMVVSGIDGSGADCFCLYIGGI